MGANSDLFLQIREQEAFDFSASKKAIIEQGQKFVTAVKDSGEVDKFELLSRVVRLKEFVNTLDAELRKEFTEKASGYGIELIPVNGRKMVQYADDPVYADLQKQLKDREELLKTALATDCEFYDSEGVQVPKVSVKYSADSLQVKF
jgi:hypothetical protein